MTPDEARQLLDGTTPGPWRVGLDRTEDETCAIHALVPRKGVILAVLIADEIDNREDADLIASAPDMAAMIAGMRAEYRVEISIDGDTWHPGGWTKSPEDAEPPDFFRLHRYTRRRIIRRYVTAEEENK